MVRWSAIEFGNDSNYKHYIIYFDDSSDDLPLEVGPVLGLIPPLEMQDFEWSILRFMSPSMMCQFEASMLWNIEAAMLWFYGLDRIL